jgi:hypothetical protein
VSRERRTARSTASARPLTGLGLEKIISGGQTGVDRAALDVALALGIPCGGWCPKGRRAEDGRIPDDYPLTESDSATYSDRTKRNVRDSEATLILTRGELRGGTLLTQRTAASLGRPCLAVDLNNPGAPAAARGWLIAHGIRVLNVAGPRESQSAGIAALAARLLRELLAGKRFKSTAAQKVSRPKKS